MSDDAYPLVPLRELRSEREEEAKRELARAIDALHDATRRREEAQARLDAHDEETRLAILQERERAPAAITPADAVRLQAWRARRRKEREAVEAERGERAREEREHEALAERARAALAEARVEREAVERHHERWGEERRRHIDAKEEAEADDLNASRFRRSPP